MIYKDEYINSPFYKLVSCLSKSSNSAVSDGLEPITSEFEKYMYIERDVDKKTEDFFLKASNEPVALLVLLGRVGEGKSRLLKNLCSKHQKKACDWEIVNDGSVSLDPDESYIEHLRKNVLQAYSDKQLTGQANAHVLLAINIGPLDSFLDTHRDEYQELSKLLSPEKSSRINDWLYCINLLSHSLFGYGSKGIEPDCIKKLLEKVFIENSDNIFLSAFKESNEVIPETVKSNFNFMSKQENIDIIASLILRSLVENKFFLSFRGLFNFIYNFIHLFSDMGVTYSLFEKVMDDSIFDMLLNSDPCNARKKEDELFIITECFNENEFNYTKAKLNTRKELFNNFGDSQTIYGDFEKLLAYAFDQSKNAILIDDVLHIADNKIKPGICSWYGVFGEGGESYIVIPYYISSKYRIAAKVSLALSDIVLKGLYEVELVFNESNESGPIKLVLDYCLFATLCEVQKGYVPNSFDKNRNPILDKFIKDLIAGYSEKKLFVDHINEYEAIDYEFTQTHQIGKSILGFNK
jgi:hypothetical protein